VALEKLIPEEVAGENTQQPQALCWEGETTKQVLELLLFLLSNNTPGVVSWSQSLDHFALSFLRQTSVLQSSLKELLASQQPSAFALRDQLWAAALRISDTSAARELLKGGVDPSKPVALKYLASRPIPGVGITQLRAALPLHMAVYAKNRQLADMLVAHGANQKAAMADISLVEFSIFVSSGPETTCEFLKEILEYRRQVITADEWAQATHNFTKRGEVSSARVLLEFYCDNMLADSSLRVEALIYAIRNSFDDLTQLVLGVGTDVNSLSRCKRYALWEAVFVERIDICELLIQCGATPQLERYDVPFLLQCAAYNGNMKLVDFLLEKGADVNRLNLSEDCRVPHSWGVASGTQLGRSALEAALYGRETEVASRLLAAGADMLGSELAISIRQGLLPLVEQLLDAGFPFPDQHGDRESALEAAIATNQVEVAHLILALRPELYEPSALCAAVHMAIMTNDLSMIEVLLERRKVYHWALEPELDKLEGTALAIAAFFGVLPIVGLLLCHGIKPLVCVFPEHMSLASPHSILQCPCESTGLAPIEAWGEECGWWRSSPDADVDTVVVSPLEAAIAGRDEGILSLMTSEGYHVNSDSITTAARIGYLGGLELLLWNSPEACRSPHALRAAFHAAIRGCHILTLSDVCCEQAWIQTRSCLVPTAL